MDSKEDSLDDFVDSLSTSLDNVLYDPLYEQLRDKRPLVGVLSEQLSDLKSFKKIDKYLRTVKVVFAIFSLITFFSGVRFLLFGSTLKAIVYIAASLDSARISANCYLKFYITQAVDKLSGLKEGGNIVKISETLLNMAKSAAGISGAEDPIKNMKSKVQWSVILQGTMTSLIWNKLVEIFMK